MVPFPFVLPFGFFPSPPTTDLLRPQVLPIPDVSVHSFVPELELVRRLNSRQSHRGHDLRLVAPFGHPSSFPRQPLPAQWWRWRDVQAFPWHGPDEHINVRELRAVLAALVWRLRIPSHIYTRFLHLSDSQVIISALAHGRSPSRALAAILMRVQAYLLAASCFALFGFVPSPWNPSDRGSRTHRLSLRSFVPGRRAP